MDTTFAVSYTPFVPLSITKEAIQPDGKIVVVGTLQPSEIPPSGFGLVRLNPDGTLDTGFGNGGITQIDFSGKGIILQPDGKILIAGDADPSYQGGTAVALARYNPDGAPDTRFGRGGEVLTTFPREQVGGVALQADGKIVVVGSIPSSERSGDSTFTVVRYTSDGTVDPTFGSGGVVTTDFGGDDQAYGVAIQPDGKIVVTGSSMHHTLRTTETPVPGNCQTTTDGSFATARYNTGGSPDNSFGKDGKVLTRFDSQEVQADFGVDKADTVVIQADGKLLVGGVAAGTFALTRYNTDGSTDGTFGAEGRTTTTFGSPGWWVQYPAIAGIALQPDGKFIVAASRAIIDPATCLDVALARYSPDGSLDTGFGTAGRTSVGVGGCITGVSGIVLQADGKVVVTAASNAARGPERMIVLRFLGDTPPLKVPFDEGDGTAEFGFHPPALSPPPNEARGGFPLASQPGINAIIQGLHQSPADETGRVHWTVGGGTPSARTASVRGPDAQVMPEAAPASSAVPSVMGPATLLAERAPSPNLPTYLHPVAEVRGTVPALPGNEISTPSYLPQTGEGGAPRYPLPGPAYLAVAQQTTSANVPTPAALSVGVTLGNASRSGATGYQPRQDFGPGTPAGGDGKTSDPDASPPLGEKPSDEEARGRLGGPEEEPAPVHESFASIAAQEVAQPASTWHWPYLWGLACGVLLILAEPARRARDTQRPRWPRPL